MQDFKTNAMILRKFIRANRKIFMQSYTKQSIQSWEQSLRTIPEEIKQQEAIIARHEADLQSHRRELITLLKQIIPIHDKEISRLQPMVLDLETKISPLKDEIKKLATLIAIHHFQNELKDAREKKHQNEMAIPQLQKLLSETDSELIETNAAIRTLKDPILRLSEDLARQVAERKDRDATHARAQRQQKTQWEENEKIRQRNENQIWSSREQDLERSQRRAYEEQESQEQLHLEQIWDTEEKLRCQIENREDSHAKEIFENNLKDMSRRHLQAQTEMKASQEGEREKREREYKENLRKREEEQKKEREEFRKRQPTVSLSFQSIKQSEQQFQPLNQEREDKWQRLLSEQKLELENLASEYAKGLNELNTQSDRDYQKLIQDQKEERNRIEQQEQRRQKQLFD